MLPFLEQSHKAKVVHLISVLPGTPDVVFRDENGHILIQKTYRRKCPRSNNIQPKRSYLSTFKARRCKVKLNLETATVYKIR